MAGGWTVHPLQRVPGEVGDVALPRGLADREGDVWLVVEEVAEEVAHLELVVAQDDDAIRGGGAARQPREVGEPPVPGRRILAIPRQLSCSRKAP